MEIEEIYNKYFTNVYRFARRLSQNAHMADELTQQTFFEALKHIDQFRGDCDIRVWLCQICKNCYYGQLRREKWTEPLSEERFAELESAENVEVQLADRDMALRIHRVLHVMEEPYKEVFTLRTFGELSFQDISRLFGKTESWARVTYYRARKKIMEELSDEDNM